MITDPARDADALRIAAAHPDGAPLPEGPLDPVKAQDPEYLRLKAEHQSRHR